MIPNISAIFATDLANGLGCQGKLPWPKISRDFQNFKHITNNSVIIMGRATWDSMGGKPLHNRFNVIITSNPIIGSSDTIFINGTVESMIDEIASIVTLPHWFVIGGAQVLKDWFPYVNSVYHTRIQGTWQADVTFDTEPYFKDFRPIMIANDTDEKSNIKFTITKYIKNR